ERGGGVVWPVRESRGGSRRAGRLALPGGRHSDPPVAGGVLGQRGGVWAGDMGSAGDAPGPGGGPTGLADCLLVLGDGDRDVRGHVACGLVGRLFFGCRIRGGAWGAEGYGVVGWI